MPFDRPSLLAAASVLAIMISAVPARAEPLADAVAAALSHHPSIEAAAANREAVREDKKEAESGLYPQISVSGTGGRNFADNSTSRGLSVSRGEGYSWLWEGTVSVTQHLWNGFETERRIDAAAARQGSAVENVADAEESLALQAVIAYLDVLRSRESVARLGAQRHKIDDYIGRIRAMVDEGAADESMIVQATDIRAQLESTIANTEAQLRSSFAAYREAIGHDPDGDMVRPVPRLDIIPEETGTAVSYALKNHPMLQAASLSKKALAYEVRAEKAAIYPDFTSELSYYERDLADVIGGEIRDAKALVRMNWDYSLGGAHEARVRRSMHREAESQFQMEETRRRIQREIDVAYSDRQAAMEQVRISQERVKLNQDLLETYNAQFEAARVNLLQLMQTDNALFNARMALLNGEFKLLAAQFAVLASMGRLREALNIVPVTAYDDRK